MSRTPTILALLGATCIAAIALNDAVTFALTGRSSNASDEFGVNPLFVFAGLTHAAAYAMFVVLLHRSGAWIDGDSRFRPVLRASLMLALLALSVGYGASTLVSVVTGEVYTSDPWSWVGGVGFLLMFVCACMLGFTLVRRPGFQLAAWTLVGIVPAILFTVALGILGSPWAHPAYAEVFAAFGLAFIGLAKRTETGTELADGSSHTSTLSPVSG